MRVIPNSLHHPSVVPRADLNVRGRKMLKEQEFPTVLIDEAAQLHEAGNLVVLRSDVERLILVGDPRQLPAVVSSDLAVCAQQVPDAICNADENARPVKRTMPVHQDPFLQSTVQLPRLG